MTAMHRDGSQLARFEQITDRTMVALSLAIIPIYVTQALTSDADGWVTRPLGLARLGIQIAMGLDLAARTYLAPKRGAYLATHKLDLLAVAAPPVRAARELVAARSILRRPGVARFGIFSSAVIIGCALVVYAAERDQDGSSIQSLGDAFWWATVTTTTVGYGDTVPITDEGRIIAVILMLLGVALLAVLTAHIAAHFVDDERDNRDFDPTNRLRQIETTLAAIELQLRQLTPINHGSHRHEEAESEGATP